MRHAILIFVGLILPVAIFSQGSNADSLTLNKQVAESFQKGDYDSAISMAEQLVKIERDSKPVKSANLATALENLAQIKFARYSRNSGDINSPGNNKKDLKGLVERSQADAKDAEAKYREALSLVQGGSADANAQIASIKTNLAWLLYNFFPFDANLPVAFDKLSRDKFDALNKARVLKRVNEAERLYHDVLTSTGDAAGSFSDQQLLALFNIAEFESAMGKFEQAIPHYEKCIESTEKKYGKKSQSLVQPLQSYSKVLAATGQDDAAFEAISRLVRVTGKTAQMPKTMLNLSMRSDDAFTSTNSPDVEERAKANSERAGMSSRGGIILSGATGEYAGTSAQATSTFGKQYYDTNRAIRVVRVLVSVSVDEKGKVFEAKALTGDSENRTAAEKRVKGWSFQPYQSSGKPGKLKGYVECIFLDN